MSDDTKASQDLSADEELSRAAAEVADEVEEIEEEVVEEEVEEEVVAEEEVVVEPEDNAERSRLGRKVKTQDDLISNLQQQIDTLEGKMTKAPVDESDPDDLLTRADADKIWTDRETKKQADILKYESAYVTKFATLDEDGTVYDEMVKNFNNRTTGDPGVDAEMNFLKAKNSLMSQGKKINLKGDTPPGINSGTKVTPPKKKLTPLTDDAKKFLKHEGLDTEWAREKLG